MSLSPSQRVSLMKEIGQRLGTEEWHVIGLTLKQFALPCSDSWGGTDDAYVLKMIENASDDALIDLAQHLGFRLEVSGTSHIEPAFWGKGKFRLFISHLAVQGKWAGELQEALIPYGISAFVAHSDIEPTSEWQNQIETALSTCDALVALLHDKFHESKWTDQEIGFAMGRSVPVCSVHFGEAPYGFIGRFQAFDGMNSKPWKLAKGLFESYLKNKQTKRKMSQILVDLFERSGTFEDARLRLGYLEQMDVWESSFAARIRTAAVSNSQIADLNGIEPRIEKLAKKWSFV